MSAVSTAAVSAVTAVFPAVMTFTVAVMIAHHFRIICKLAAYQRLYRRVSIPAHTPVKLYAGFGKTQQPAYFSQSFV